MDSDQFPEDVEMTQEEEEEKEETQKNIILDILTKPDGTMSDDYIRRERQVVELVKNMNERERECLIQVLQLL